MLYESTGVCPLFVMHILPKNAFVLDDHPNYSPDEIQLRFNTTFPLLIACEEPVMQSSAEGVCYADTSADNAQAHTLIFYNGMIEAVKVLDAQSMRLAIDQLSSCCFDNIEQSLTACVYSLIKTMSYEKNTFPLTLSLSLRKILDFRCLYKFGGQQQSIMTSSDPSQVDSTHAQTMIAYGATTAMIHQKLHQALSQLVTSFGLLTFPQDMGGGKHGHLLH